MPVFDAKNLTIQDEDEALLAMILHPTAAARDEARERGRARIERATMLAELVPSLPGTTLASVAVHERVPVV